MRTWPFTPAGNAAVTVDDKKIRIEIPQMLTYSYFGGVDSVNLEGVVIER